MSNQEAAKHVNFARDEGNRGDFLSARIQGFLEVKSVRIWVRHIEIIKPKLCPHFHFLKRDRLMFHHCINLKKVYSNTSFAFSFIFWIRFAHDGLPCSIMFYQSVSVLAYASLSQVKRLVTRPIFSVCICCFQLDERAIKSCSLSLYIYICTVHMRINAYSKT